MNCVTSHFSMNKLSERSFHKFDLSYMTNGTLELPYPTTLSIVLSMTIQLVPLGDRELWRAAANDNSWSLPLYVDWRWHKEEDTHYALVMPAVGLYTSQHLLLKALLDAHDIQGREDQWLIPRRIAEAILHKAPGITPLAYYKWADPRCPALPMANSLTLSPKGPIVRNTPGSNDYEAFVRHLCKVNSLPNSVVRVVLRAVGDTAAKWMLEERKPLDLGFCRLIAAPFRPNWKEIVSFKFRKWKLLKLFNSQQKVKLTELENAGVPSVLCSLHNVGLSRGRAKAYQVMYTLEAIPSKKFENAVNVVESKRQACGTTSYVASFETTVEALYPHLLAALENHLRKVGAPFARVCERGVSGVLRFLPTLGLPPKVRGVGLRQLPVHIVEADRCFSVNGEKSDLNLICEKTPPLPALPALSQGQDDVRGRQEQRQLDAPRDRKQRASRLPLLHVDQGDNSGQPVLSCATVASGEASGMDREGDKP